MHTARDYDDIGEARAGNSIIIKYLMLISDEFVILEDEKQGGSYHRHK